jgi:hypothetical protein
LRCFRYAPTRGSPFEAEEVANDWHDEVSALDRAQA